MNSEIDSKLLDLLCRIFGERHRPLLTLDTTMDDVDEWDSLTFIDIIVQIEADFGVTIDPDEAIEMTRVGTIQNLIKQKTEAGA